LPYASANGLNLYYEMTNKDIPHNILLIPGLGGDHRNWHKLIPHINHNHNIITFDNRDSCFSDRAHYDYSIKDMAQDVAELLKSLDIHKTHVVGYSMGGAIAQEMAISFPYLVDHLILLATYTSGDPRGDAIFRTFASIKAKVSEEEFLRLILPWSFSIKDFEVPGFIEEVIYEVSKDQFRQEPTAYERQMKATISFQSRGRLNNISSPTLLIFGDEDILTPMRFARELVSDINGSRLIIIQNAGHGLLITRPKEMALAINSFLR
jgi:3-oxoadipate enol-lactonase